VIEQLSVTAPGSRNVFPTLTDRLYLWHPSAKLMEHSIQTLNCRHRNIWRSGLRPLVHHESLGTRPPPRFQEPHVKKLEAIVQPFKLDEIQAALAAIGAEGITVSEARGHGRQKGRAAPLPHPGHGVDILPKIKLETVVPDSRAEEIVKVIEEAARTGRVGDGKIFVFNVAQAIRIRNGDLDDAAI
jgi:nitrogen regulatory protein P-II 1